MKSRYLELIKDPRWQRRRLEILQKDNFTCQMCGATDKTLNVHHMYYSRKIKFPWDYDDESLITLCDDCHKKEHTIAGKKLNSKSQIYTAILELRKLLTASEILCILESINEQLSFPAGSEEQQKIVKEICKSIFVEGKPLLLSTDGIYLNYIDNLASRRTRLHNETKSWLKSKAKRDDEVPF